MSVMRNIHANRLISQLFIGSSVGVYASWNYSERGEVYALLNNLPSISPVPILPEPSKLRNILERDFVFDSKHPEKPQTWLLSALSHRDTVHCAFNLITFSSFAKVLWSLPTYHFCSLLVGSALASQGAFLYERRSSGRNGRSLGASGVVSGVLTTVTCLIPRYPIRAMLILPMPLWVATAGYFLVDSYMMTSRAESGIAHSAHIGGGLFGIAYFLLFRRSFGIRTPKF